jgi:hypothetical protein
MDSEQQMWVNTIEDRKQKLDGARHDLQWALKRGYKAGLTARQLGSAAGMSPTGALKLAQEKLALPRHRPDHDVAEGGITRTPAGGDNDL